MSAIAQLQIAVWFTGICVIAAFSFLGWLLWTMFWNWYDNFTGMRRRRVNNAAHQVGRDCYRDVRGLTK